MKFKGKRIGFGLTGSHCTYDEVMPEIEKLVKEGADVLPVVSNTVKTTTTRFGKGEDWIKRVEEITGNKVIDSIVAAEPLGPKIPLDCMVIAPFTGNSMSKFANAMTDSPVLMAAKATLRNLSPVVLGISTNDALGLNGVNLMRLMATKNIYFIPYGQDAPMKKPNSMVARMGLLQDTVLAAMEGKQLQPVIIEKFRDSE
ncbi:dipicolinate synthase subunit B [Bacillus luteolus]|uniref:Dipicolinate synthase subunit B n=1 Tax=Litchfieldia luteola TaxID=682179 RepID=A0ABR9QJJ7_9BACI|nr:dipicolinate synthase subunit B [Cytobacillus luteolus]MBE4908677.1 dipicolinate synthase subunit B [Cytobacillus luteolus]MBP1941534.1 dipicolinate synthase subunit B [Cytobacillus luteolus]